MPRIVHSPSFPSIECLLYLATYSSRDSFLISVVRIEQFEYVHPLTHLLAWSHLQLLLLQILLQLLLLPILLLHTHFYGLIKSEQASQRRDASLAHRPLHLNIHLHMRLSGSLLLVSSVRTFCSVTGPATGLQLNWMPQCEIN